MKKIQAEREHSRKRYTTNAVRTLTIVLEQNRSYFVREGCVVTLAELQNLSPYKSTIRSSGGSQVWRSVEDVLWFDTMNSYVKLLRNRIM